MYWEHKFNPSEGFAESHTHNFQHAKFKIGEQILLKREHGYKELDGRLFIVTGISWIDTEENGSPIFEYSLKGFPYLCWELELEKL